MNRKIINTNIRFNLDNEDDRKAYEYLQSMDRKQYKSYTKAVVIAVNEYFCALPAKMDTKKLQKTK